MRFFRWALEQVRTAPNGALLAFVTNHSYLDGPVHRGMRAALRSAFDRIEVLELGGNALLSRGSGRDENVFGVRVGAALMLGSRLPGSHRRQAALHVARVTGTRDEKLGSLHRAPLVALQDNAPEAPWSPRTNKRFERASLSLSQIFPFHREGIQTNRDAVATAHTHVELANRLADIAEGRLQLKASRHFEPKQAQSVLQRALSDGNLGIRTLAYRPLDTRVFCSLQPVCHRPRPELLKAMDHSNLCLLSVRKDRGEAPFRLFAASRHVADSCYLSTRSSCRTRVFPSRTPEGLENLSAHAQEAFGRIGTVMTAETVMAYALGLLLSSSYREEQGDALKEDYAAIALPPSAAAFTELVQAGRYLIDALTADARELSAPQARPSTGQRVTGSVDLDALRFSADRRVLLLGSEIVVEGVGTETWECVVGQFKLRQTAGPAPRAKMPLSDLLLCLQRAEQIERAHTLADKKFREHFL